MLFGGLQWTWELPGCSVPPVDCEGATSYRVAPLTRIGDGMKNRRKFGMNGDEGRVTRDSWLAKL